MTVKRLVTIFDTLKKRRSRLSLFVQRLNDLIENSGKQQQEICDELGIYKQKFSRWKTGFTEPNFDDLIMLANYFEVSADFLLGLEDETGTKTNLYKK